jgi:hypothetical protein
MFVVTSTGVNQIKAEEQSHETYKYHWDISQVQVQRGFTETKIYGTIKFVEGTVCGNGT